MNLFLILFPFLLGLAPQQPAAQPKLRVVTTLGVLASLAREVGGERVEAEALANPQQDPHFVQPRPTLMEKARAADVFVELGMQLELWAQKVVEGSGNPRIQPGQPARVVASSGITALELPRELSREWGDVHPYGNPHIWLDPLNTKDMAANIAAGLEAVDPAHKDEYETNLKRFQERIDAALFGAELVKQVGGRMLTRQARGGHLAEYLAQKQYDKLLGGWLAKAAPLAGRPVVTYHKSWVYFAERFGLKIPIEIEEKPGIPPSARHRDAVVELMKKQQVHTVLHEVFYDQGAADYLANETGAHKAIVPIDVGVEAGAKDYFALVDLWIDRLLAAESAAPAK
jgi:zinc/manganese transport system substrate-binding protein